MKSLVKKEFGRRLKMARRAAKMNQSRFGELVGGAEVSTVSRWEQGVFMPDEKHFELICQVLKKPASYFLDMPVGASQTVEEILPILKKQEERIRELEHILTSIPKDLLALVPYVEKWDTIRSAFKAASAARAPATARAKEKV